jgi:hypothetical protein
VNPTEAGQLLAHAAAFDNRKPSTAAALAWAAALRDVPLDPDALNAVAAYYGAPGDPSERRWLQPHHIRHYRSQARAERIDAAKPMYDGNPNETPEEAVDNLRALIDDAASGRLPARSIGDALESSPQAIRGRKLLELEAAYIGKPVAPPRPGVVNVLAVPCPHCASPAGKTCVSGHRKKIRHADAHPSRLDAARRAAAGLPDDVA